MSHPQSYEILLFPEPEEPVTGAPPPGTAIRSAVVAATGDTGETGYPRYAGNGMEADIDPASHTVEALLVDGAELDYGLTARIADRIRGPQETEEEPAAAEQTAPAEPEPGHAGAQESGAGGAGAQGAGAEGAGAEGAGTEGTGAGAGSSDGTAP
ncbi:hypothetical protein OG939_02145 [Streptomyces sp. NBC_01685]|uniref:hypothetical protein n=1 Tax=Streptomyces sp. NBC_01685 TaxID=2975910 RepID=UPI002E3266A9|nr:hypothetical protein [Streptomyces sp. NBC_01685]